MNELLVRVRVRVRNVIKGDWDTPPLPISLYQNGGTRSEVVRINELRMRALTRREEAIMDVRRDDGGADSGNGRIEGDLLPGKRKMLTQTEDCSSEDGIGGGGDVGW